MTGNGITRGPALQFPSATRAVAFKGVCAVADGLAFMTSQASFLTVSVRYFSGRPQLGLTVKRDLMPSRMPLTPLLALLGSKVSVWGPLPSSLSVPSILVVERSRCVKLWFIPLGFLQLKVGLAGRKTFVRFKAVTGDAMGMNMITKGVNEALKRMSDEFGDMELLRLLVLSPLFPSSSNPRCG